jgi:hypothetical protein
MNLIVCRFLIIMVIILGLHTEQLNAASFSPVEQERYVSASSQFFDPWPISGGEWVTYNDRKDATNFERFNATAQVPAYYGRFIYATQDSTITATNMSVTYSIEYQEPAATSQSSFKVVFDLDTFAQVHLFGYLSPMGGINTTSLVDSGGAPIFQFESRWYTDLDYSYWIGAGRYTFLVREVIEAGMTSIGDVSLEIVPEPATLLLLGLGGMFLRSRKH